MFLFYFKILHLSFLLYISNLDHLYIYINIQVSLEKDAWPNGIVVDTRYKRLYWAEGSRSFIKSVALDGELDVKVFSESVNHPYSLTILGMLCRQSSIICFIKN